MGSRDRPVNDELMTVRLPAMLRLMIDVLSVRQCKTNSQVIRDLLETHPEVVGLADRVYNIVDSSPDGKVAPSHDGNSAVARVLHGDLHCC
jgi:hypothetical protein